MILILQTSATNCWAWLTRLINSLLLRYYYYAVLCFLKLVLLSMWKRSYKPGDGSSHACLCGFQWYKCSTTFHVYIISIIYCDQSRHVTCASAQIMSKRPRVNVIHCTHALCKVMVSTQYFPPESQLLSRMKAFLFLLAIVSFTLVTAQEPQRCSKCYRELASPS